MVVSHIFRFHPDPWGDEPIFTIIFFAWVWFNHQLENAHESIGFLYMPTPTTKNIRDVLTSENWKDGFFTNRFNFSIVHAFAKHVPFLEALKKLMFEGVFILMVKNSTPGLVKFFRGGTSTNHSSHGPVFQRMTVIATPFFWWCFFCFYVGGSWWLVSN